MKKNVNELIRYIIIGVFTTLISLATYYLLKEYIFIKDSQINIQVCTVISWIMSVTFAYITNRIIVFRSENSKIFKEAAKFYFARLSTLIIDSVSMCLLTDIANLDDKMAKIIVQALILVLNYLFSKFAVFNKKD